MSQHDMIIADTAGAAFLADLNLAVKALAENNYGTTEPAVMYAHMWWADTAADILKKRNAANTGWISYLTLSTGALLGQGLGTPASGVLTNCTGTAAGLSIGGNAATATISTNNISNDVGVHSVGTIMYMSNESGGTVNSGATVSGTSLRDSLTTPSGGLSVGAYATGTWRNITGTNINNIYSGMFQRIS